MFEVATTKVRKVYVTDTFPRYRKNYTANVLYWDHTKKASELKKSLSLSKREQNLRGKILR